MKTSLLPVYMLCAVLGGATYIFLLVNTKWTLFPYTKTLELLFGFHFYYTGAFYETAGSNLVITKTCSGINLFLSLYSILIFGFLHNFNGIKKRLVVSLSCFVITLLIAYITTLVRIIVSLPFCESQHFKLIHTVISLCIFFGTGFLVYLSAQKCVKKF